MTMPTEQALNIVEAINQRLMVSMGIGDDKPLLPLDGITLAQMLEATHTVETMNDRASEAAKQSGGGYTIHMVPAERLIAAVFVSEHYPVSHDSILMLPPARPHGHPRALLFWPVAPGDIPREDEDGES